MFFLSLCLFRCLLWCAGACRDVEHLEGRWPPRRMDLVTSGASRVVSIILAWKVIYPVVRQLTHEGSFPLSPQRAFPNREVIKELSTTLRFTSSGVLPPFLPGACYPNALFRHSSYSEPAGYREVETCPSPLGPVRTWQCSPTCLCSLKTSISRHKHRKQNSEGDTGRRGEGGALEGKKKTLLPSSS